MTRRKSRHLDEDYLLGPEFEKTRILWRSLKEQFWLSRSASSSPIAPMLSFVRDVLLDIHLLVEEEKFPLNIPKNPQIEFKTEDTIRKGTWSEGEVTPQSFLTGEYDATFRWHPESVYVADALGNPKQITTKERNPVVKDAVLSEFLADVAYAISAYLQGDKKSFMDFVRPQAETTVQSRTKEQYHYHRRRSL